MSRMNNDDSSVPARQELMKICAQASEAELERVVASGGCDAEAEDVRAPEAGLVMLRGRIGGDGAVFNVGEATVTRAVVRLRNGTLGYSYLLGRTPRKARLAAIIDALGQDETWRETLTTALIEPVERRRAAEERKASEETAATRVNFFTLVRGED